MRRSQVNEDSVLMRIIGFSLQNSEAECQSEPIAYDVRDEEMLSASYLLQQKLNQNAQASASGASSKKRIMPHIDPTK